LHIGQQHAIHLELLYIDHIAELVEVLANGF
jgi:hypothetical protein